MFRHLNCFVSGFWCVLLLSPASSALSQVQPPAAWAADADAGDPFCANLQQILVELPSLEGLKGERKKDMDHPANDPTSVYAATKTLPGSGPCDILVSQKGKSRPVYGCSLPEDIRVDDCSAVMPAARGFFLKVHDCLPGWTFNVSKNTVIELTANASSTAYPRPTFSISAHKWSTASKCMANFTFSTQ